MSNLEFLHTEVFLASYSRLSANNQKHITSAMRKLGANPHSPFPRGLKVHILKGVKGTPLKKGGRKPPVWELHAGGGKGGGDMLITFQYGENSIILRNCGSHDVISKNP